MAARPEDEHKTRDELIAELKALRARERAYLGLAGAEDSARPPLDPGEHSGDSHVRGPAETRIARWESAQALRTIIAHTTVGIVLTDERGTILEWNPAQERITGLSRADVLGRKLWDVQFETMPQELRRPQAYEGLKAGLLAFGRRGIPPSPRDHWEGEIETPDGTRRAVEIMPFTINVDDSFILASLCQDITERRQAQEALRESERKLRGIVEDAQDGIVLTDEDGRLVEWNPALEAITGLRRESVLGRLLWDVQHELVLPARRIPEMYERAREAMLGLLGGDPLSEGQGYHERNIQRPDGTQRMLQASPFRILTPKGFMLGSSFRDITAQRQAEAALRESERSFRDLLENMDLLAAMADVDGNVTFCNDSMLRLTGWTREEVIGHNWCDMFIPAPARTWMKETMAKRLRSGISTERHEGVLQTRDGKLWTMSVTDTLLRSPQGEVIGTAIIGEDVTARQQASEEARRLSHELERRVLERTARLQSALEDLQASEERYRSLFEAAREGILILDSDGRAVSANPAAVAILGYASVEELLGSFSIEAHLAPASFSEARQTLEANGYLEAKALTMRRRDGSRAYVLLGATTFEDRRRNVPQLEAVFTDITEQRRTEERLRRSAAQFRLKMINAQETERRRVAHDLHDVVGQALTSAIFALDMAADGGARAKEVETVRLILLDCMQSVREISGNLLPPAMEALGLVPALAWLFRQSHLEDRVELDWRAIGMPDRLPPEVELAVFRIVQEAINNIMKHSQATAVEIIIEARDGRIEASISDNGIGFDLRSVSEGGNPEGISMGLPGMKERAEVLSGTFEAESAPGEGTRLLVSIPFRPS